MSRLGTWLALLVAFGAAASLRQTLRRERRELGLVPQAAQAPDAEDGAWLPARQAVLLSSGLGLGRALAIDFFTLRAVHLQENGDFSESAALARLITTLEPRLPQAWSFQAHNLAFNISPFFSPPERFPWVERGLRLLIDEGLRHNPRSIALHQEIAFTFLIKIGHDSEAASPLYRSRLAAIFEGARPEAIAAWRLDPARLRQLETDLGVPLDVRAAPTHALHWAEAGLGVVGSGVSREPEYLRRLLEDVAVSSLVELYRSGRPVRVDGGDVYVFLPEPRWAAPVERRIGREATSGGPRARLAQEALGIFQAEKAFVSFLLGREEEARRHAAAVPATSGLATGSLEDLLVERMTLIEERSASAAAADCLAASLLLRRLGEDRLAASHEELARWLLAASGAALALPLGEALEAARQRVESPWPADHALPFRLEQLLRAGAEETR